ncbi:MAG: transcriptional repressor [Firmicutes bacterium]|nr:transcriptional repressor [Bacillota bacterium]
MEHGIKPSYPRIKILEYLITKRSHPTVDEIYSNLVKEIPTLSKTTVYNTLNLLISANIVRVVASEENETRYDADVTSHGHFKCEKCGAIYDFRIDVGALKTDDLKNFKIKEKNVYYRGICEECLDNIENKI